MNRPPRYIRRMSPKRRSRVVDYHKQRRWFLVAHPWCAWGIAQSPPMHLRSTQVHHTRGRAGALLTDERFWLAVSAVGHDWIHSHPNEARKLGLLCQKGQWNQPLPLSDPGPGNPSPRMAVCCTAASAPARPDQPTVGQLGPDSSPL